MWNAAADRGAVMSEIRSTCPYCGVGCGVVIESDGDRIVGVRGDPDHPANFGRLCTKGATLHLSAGAEVRALHPEFRPTRDAVPARVTWDWALEHAADRFADCIRQHGPDSVAFYISGQLLTEDYYVFNKLVRAVAGTNNIDTNSRLCMSSAVSGYKLTLGADAPPCCYDDIASADLLFIAGSNTAWAHPIVYRRIEDAKHANPDLKIIVVDPRRTATAEHADLHLAIRPGSDVALFNAMLHVMHRDGLVNEGYIADHTTGYEALAGIAERYSPARAAVLCDVDATDIERAAHAFARSKAALSLYCQGLNQSTQGAHKNATLINLHLATGQIGRPGAGPFSLTGQPNAMGGREVGGMATLLGGHRDPANPDHRAEVAELWGIPSLPDRPGKTAVDIFEGLHSGSVRMVWIACTNPAHSLPDADRVKAALQRAEFVVVQDAYRHTDTTACADLLLPATTWPEKDGTVTNSERRITRVRPSQPPPGQNRHDWVIARDFALRLGTRLGVKEIERLFAFDDPSSVFEEHRALTANRDLDITGLSYDVLEQQGPQQWPYRSGDTTGSTRLYANGIFPTADGRARFVAAEHALPAELPDDNYPFSLLTGRLRDQWHGMSRTGRIATLMQHCPEPEVAVHADDLARMGLKTGELVRISSRRGAIVMKALASDEVKPGVVYAPMHWNRQFLNSAGINTLTVPAYDPISRQPELKHAAVTLAPAQLGWRCAFLRSFPLDEPGANDKALDFMQRAAPLLAAHPYAALTWHAGKALVVTLELAAESAPPDLTAIERLFDLHDEPRLLVYRDVARHIDKRGLVNNHALVSLKLGGDLSGLDQRRGAMLEMIDVRPLRLALLSPASLTMLPPPPGRTVCNCHGITEPAIDAALIKGATLEELQRTLKCGTSCGSCLPELRKMVMIHRPAAVA